jgi:osmotically-inducible protein OsmY
MVGTGRREAGRDPAATAAKAAGAVVDETRDAAITVETNALLARDIDPSALGINVDTAGGRVVFRGDAPDAAARDRATQLALRVDGVVGVNNELRVRT